MIEKYFNNKIDDLMIKYIKLKNNKEERFLNNEDYKINLKNLENSIKGYLLELEELEEEKKEISRTIALDKKGV